jgi:glucosylceramidase
LSTSFLNESGELVVVVMNESDADTDFNLWIEGKSSKLSAPAHSIQTIVL